MNVYEIGAAWEKEIAAEERRNSGSHYTPPSLAQQIVELTLQAAVYKGVENGAPMNAATLKSPDEILALRVIDISCGAGAFLFAATHYLALKLLESRALQQGVDSFGWRLTPVIPRVPRTEAVSDPVHTLVNPASQAWMDARLPGAMVEVMSHCIRGVDLSDRVVQLTQFLFWINADCPPGLLTRLRQHLIAADSLRDEWWARMADVSGRGGFDAVIGNPPYLGGHKITGVMGTAYRDEMVERLAGGKKGAADLCAYFLLQSMRILKPGGVLGLVTTNTIAQGATRKVGLDQVVEGGNTIFHAMPSLPWPGEAAVTVSEFHIYKGKWNGKRYLRD